MALQLSAASKSESVAIKDNDFQVMRAKGQHVQSDLETGFRKMISTDVKEADVWVHSKVPERLDQSFLGCEDSLWYDSLLARVEPKLLDLSLGYIRKDTIV